MFIPRGKVIHENLATSYLLLDALVSDLCEGGFSGVVEIVLRDTDAYIVITGGNLSAVIDTRGDTCTRTSIAQLAEQSRLERGRVSVYAYSAETAKAVAGRINAQTLYAGLSTEFTDLEKMIWKLAREREREWFVEIKTESGLNALMHMRDSRCRIISSPEDASAEASESLDLVGNEALGKLVHECNRAGGTFDVCFRHVAEATELQADNAHIEPATTSRSPETGARLDEAHIEAEAATYSPATPDAKSEHDLLIDSIQEEELLISASPPPEPERHAQIGEFNTLSASAAATPLHISGPAEPAPSVAEDNSKLQWSAVDTSTESREDEFVYQHLPNEWSEEVAESLLGRESVHSLNDDEAMSEVRRLIGEIARTIEEAAQAVDRHDSFSMSLRAGQLKIADRYPFLDPFAGEFEYLAGEIVFVGQATADEFTAGLTEALKLAAQAVMQSSGYAERFRAFVIEDLQKLRTINRSEFEKFGLDKVIDEIISF